MRAWGHCIVRELVLACLLTIRVGSSQRYITPPRSPQFPLLNSYAPNFFGLAPPNYVFSSYAAGGFKFQGPTPRPKPATSPSSSASSSESGGQGASSSKEHGAGGHHGKGATPTRSLTPIWPAAIPQYAPQYIQAPSPVKATKSAPAPVSHPPSKATPTHGTQQAANGAPGMSMPKGPPPFYTPPIKAANKKSSSSSSSLGAKSSSVSTEEANVPGRGKRQKGRGLLVIDGRGGGPANAYWVG